MSAANGYNPLRWQCSESGCYNRVHRPKIEIFAGDLPGRIALTDIDATVEVNGHFLFLEFKSGMPRDIPVGQRIYFERLTALSARIKAIVVCCDAATMVVRACKVFERGGARPWEILTTEDLHRRIRAWAGAALKAGNRAA
jgi:hypothetical protein